jgi:hypothetical protein
MTNTVWTEADLYAYLDGELSEQERVALEEDMADNVGLRRELKDLRQTLALFQEAPLREAPRNYLLTPSMVEEKSQDEAPKPRRRLLFMTRLAASLSALIFVITVGMQINLSGGMPAATTAPVAEPRVAVTQEVEESLGVSSAEEQVEAPEAAAEEEMAALAATPTVAGTPDTREMPPGDAPAWESEEEGMGGLGLGGGGDEAVEKESANGEAPVGICSIDNEEACDDTTSSPTLTTTEAPDTLPEVAVDAQEQDLPPLPTETPATERRSPAGQRLWLLLAILSGGSAVGFGFFAWRLARKK